MHLNSADVVSPSQLRGDLPLRPLALTSPPQKAIDTTNLDPYVEGPKSPNVVIPLTSPPFRPHQGSPPTSSSPPEALSLPPAAAKMSVPADASSQPAEVLFNPSLISAEISKKLPEGYVIRPLMRTDYAAGMLDVLRVLTTVGDISEKDWVERFEYMKKREGDYFVIVVEDGQRKIVGTGCVVAERKL